MVQRQPIAVIVFNLLNGAYRNTYGNHLRLERMHFYETPRNWTAYLCPELLENLS